MAQIDKNSLQKLANVEDDVVSAVFLPHVLHGEPENSSSNLTSLTKVLILGL